MCYETIEYPCSHEVRRPLKNPRCRNPSSCIAEVSEPIRNPLPTALEAGSASIQRDVDHYITGNDFPFPDANYKHHVTPGLLKFYEQLGGGVSLEMLPNDARIESANAARIQEEDQNQDIRVHDTGSLTSGSTSPRSLSPDFELAVSPNPTAEQRSPIQIATDEYARTLECSYAYAFELFRMAVMEALENSQQQFKARLQRNISLIIQAHTTERRQSFGTENDELIDLSTPLQQSFNYQVPITDDVAFNSAHLDDIYPTGVPSPQQHLYPRTQHLTLADEPFHHNYFHGGSTTSRQPFKNGTHDSTFLNESGSIDLRIPIGMGVSVTPFLNTFFPSVHTAGPNLYDEEAELAMAQLRAQQLGNYTTTYHPPSAQYPTDIDLVTNPFMEDKEQNISVPTFSVASQFAQQDPSVSHTPEPLAPNAIDSLVISDWNAVMQDVAPPANWPLPVRRVSSITSIQNHDDNATFDSNSDICGAEFITKPDGPRCPMCELTVEEMVNEWDLMNPYSAGA